MLDKAHHFMYAVCGLFAIVTVAFIFKPDHRPPSPVGVPVIAQPGTTVRELEALKHSYDLLAAAKGAVPQYLAPAVSVIPSNSGFSGAAMAQILGALGNARTAPAYHVTLVAPTPRPILYTPPPEVSTAYADWHHQDVYNATAEAVAATKVAVTVTQEPVPPSRITALYTADSSSGIAYALKRRGQFDLVIAAMKGKDGRVGPAAGYAYRVKGTAASVFAGFKLSQGRPGPAFGFGVSF